MEESIENLSSDWVFYDVTELLFLFLGMIMVLCSV